MKIKDEKKKYRREYSETNKQPTKQKYDGICQQRLRRDR
jgi:hypothetical protein